MNDDEDPVRNRLAAASALAVLTTVLLSACSATVATATTPTAHPTAATVTHPTHPVSPSATPSATADAVSDGSFDAGSASATLSALQSAMDGLGDDCVTSGVDASSGFGAMFCGYTASSGQQYHEDVSVYGTQAGYSGALQSMGQLHQIGLRSGNDWATEQVLIGSTWTVDGADDAHLAALQAKVGGRAVALSSFTAPAVATPSPSVTEDPYGGDGASWTPRATCPSGTQVQALFPGSSVGDSQFGSLLAATQSCTYTVAVDSGTYYAVVDGVNPTAQAADLPDIALFGAATPSIAAAPSLGTGAQTGISADACAVAVPVTNPKRGFQSLLVTMAPTSYLTGRDPLPRSLCQVVPLLRLAAAQQ